MRLIIWPGYYYNIIRLIIWPGYFHMRLIICPGSLANVIKCPLITGVCEHSRSHIGRHVISLALILTDAAAWSPHVIPITQQRNGELTCQYFSWLRSILFIEASVILRNIKTYFYTFTISRFDFKEALLLSRHDLCHWLLPSFPWID